jgi:hypothetical protein
MSDIIIDIPSDIAMALKIPDAVWHESVIEGAGKPGAITIRRATFLKRRHLSDKFQKTN